MKSGDDDDCACNAKPATMEVDPEAIKMKQEKWKVRAEATKKKA